MSTTHKTRGAGEDASEITLVKSFLEQVEDVLGGFEFNPLTRLVSDCIRAAPSPRSVPSFREELEEIKSTLESLHTVLDNDEIPECGQIGHLDMARIELLEKLNRIQESEKT